MIDYPVYRLVQQKYLALSMCYPSRKEKSYPESDLGHQDCHFHHGPREQGYLLFGFKSGSTSLVCHQLARTRPPSAPGKRLSSALSLGG